MLSSALWWCDKRQRHGAASEELSYVLGVTLPLSSSLFPEWKCTRWQSIPVSMASDPSSLTLCNWTALSSLYMPAVKKQNEMNISSHHIYTSKPLPLLWFDIPNSSVPRTLNRQKRNQRACPKKLTLAHTIWNLQSTWTNILFSGYIHLSNKTALMQSPLIVL